MSNRLKAAAASSLLALAALGAPLTLATTAHAAPEDCRAYVKNLKPGGESACNYLLGFDDLCTDGKVTQGSNPFYLSAYNMFHGERSLGLTEAQAEQAIVEFCK